MDVLIVGAGLAGLIAAQELRKHGLSVLLVDKGRNVGGRLATRRVGQGQADVGAQFFTARSPQFQGFIAGWQAHGLMYVWSNGWPEANGRPAADGHPRYAVRGGMNALAQALARELAIQLNVKISALSPVRDGWQVMDTDGRIFASRAVLLTAPVPQSLTFVETGRTPMQAADLDALRQIVYAPCLAGLYWLDRAAKFPEPGAIQPVSAKVSWAADNRRKGISVDATVLTVHGSPEFSRASYSAREADVLTELLTEVKPWLGEAALKESQLRRWRYARPTEMHPERRLVAAGVPPLVFAGDAFGEPRAEGAALSGLAAAEALVKLLT